MNKQTKRTFWATSWIQTQVVSPHVYRPCNQLIHKSSHSGVEKNNAELVQPVFLWLDWLLGKIYRKPELFSHELNGAFLQIFP